MSQTFSKLPELRFQTLASEIEGMILKVIGLLFFVLFLGTPLTAEDYQVQKGDSSASISQKVKVPADILQRANPNQDWDQLKPSDHLAIPERYVVKAGDTLYSLCRLWGVEQTDFLAFNGWSGPTTLRSGQTVFVPVARARVSDSNGFWPVNKVPHSEGDKVKSVTFTTTGEPFRSVSDGTVVYLGEFRGVGRVLMVETADKAVFAYGNFETSAVDFGQLVAKGQVLGTTSPRPSQKLSFFSFRQNELLDVFTIKR